MNRIKRAISEIITALRQIGRKEPVLGGWVVDRGEMSLEAYKDAIRNAGK